MAAVERSSLRRQLHPALPRRNHPILDGASDLALQAQASRAAPAASAAPPPFPQRKFRRLSAIFRRVYHAGATQEDTVCVYSSGLANPNPAAVLASVYLLRDRGVRLPRPRRPVDGHLILGPGHAGSQPTLRARLVTGNEGDLDILPELVHARVLRISANGIAITGLEYIARSSHSKAGVSRFRQSWWCLIATLTAAQMAGLGELYEDEVMGGDTGRGSLRF